jgi:CRISPR system Cascade subunit CasD
VLAVTDFLLFTLHAPLASWGDIAVGETRGSWDRPSRSAVLGLVAAALGLTREAQADHDALDTGYGVAVWLSAAGSPLMDYHTAQTTPASVARKVASPTRARLLAAGEPQTILSRRAYRQDAVATVALWSRGSARWTLEEVAEALRRPAFGLYAGRKANALGLPLAPEVIPAATLAEAFLRRAELHGIGLDAPGTARDAMGRLWEALRPRNGWGREVAHDAWEGNETGLQPQRREIRRDAAAHRVRWHFAERAVEVGLLPLLGGPEAAP